MRVPGPLLLLEILPSTRADHEALLRGLQEMAPDDPAIMVRTDDETRVTVIGAMGERQLETIVDRLKRDFNVKASVGKPQVAYKETLTRAADGEVKYARQTGGRGQYGHVKIHLFPGEPGAGYVFGNKVPHGEVPKEFIKPIDEGIKEALARGVIAGYPIDDVRVELFGGSYHDVDSSEVAFKIAGAMAFQDAAKKAGPVILEPIMKVKVIMPGSDADDVIDDLTRRRGTFRQAEAGAVAQAAPGMHVIEARVPLAGLLGYAGHLRSQISGRATCSMSFDRYDPTDAQSDLGDGDSFVGAPRRPVLPRNQLSVELPEPDDDRY